MAKGVRMKSLKRLVIIFVLFSLISCVSTREYIPKHALTDPTDSISVPHPIELEKAGIKTITTFQGLLDPGLWVEVVNAGGVWPFLAQTSSGEILSGYAYLFGLTYWGDWQLQFVFLGDYKKIKTAKILYFNRDAGFCYQLHGDQIKYDPKKFENNIEYQKSLFEKYGKNLKEMDEFWKEHLVQKGLEPPSDFTGVVQIKIPSPKWNEYKEKLSVIMQYNYKMGDEEIRCGYLPLDLFKQAAVEIPGFNGVDRYLKRAKVPLFALPFSGVGLLTSVGASLASDAIIAGVDPSWTGAYARAKVLRYKMAPLFRHITLIYKELLQKRDERLAQQLEIIKNLKFKLIFQD